MKTRIFQTVIFLLSMIALRGQTTYLQCGKMIDVRNLTVREAVTIRVESNRIDAVMEGYVGDGEDGEIIDLKGATVMPGWIDMHVHLEGELGKGSYINRFTLSDADMAYRAWNYADRTLKAGFTTVRDLGGTGVNNALKNAINQGWVNGPRIYTVVRSIAITGGHGDPTNGYRPGLGEIPTPSHGVADGPYECVKAVRQQVKDGADVIKITATGGVLSIARDGKKPQFKEEEIRAIVETANDFGLHVAAHAHGDEGMQRAVRAGVKTIEHGTLMSEETMDMMIERGTYFVPTITAGKSVADSAKSPGFFPPIIRPKALEIGPQIQSTFRKAYKRGVPIAFGTDAGVFPHGKNALEFVYMAEAGMPVLEVIQAATLTNATILENPNIGVIETGKLADLVAVAGDPVENIQTMLKPVFVMKDGKVVISNNE